MSTATAAAAKPNANETRPAATLSADPVAAYGPEDPYSMCCTPIATPVDDARIDSVDEFRELSPSTILLSACVFAVKVASSKRRCCGSTSRASPRRVANASTSNVSGSPGRNAPNLGGFGFDPAARVAVDASRSTSHRAIGTTVGSTRSNERCASRFDASPAETRPPHATATVLPRRDEGERSAI